jgi:hypothetical protein
MIFRLLITVVRKGEQFPWIVSDQLWQGSSCCCRSPQVIQQRPDQPWRTCAVMTCRVQRDREIPSASPADATGRPASIILNNESR